MQGLNYSGPQFEKVVRATKPRGLRFPGGTLANNYLWNTDNFFDPSANDLTAWAGEHLRIFRKSGAAYDLPGFVRICRREGLEPIWVLNVYEETPESVVAMMRHLDSLGLKVRHIEMANEPYWDKRSANNVRAYIQFCRPLALALKKHDPALRIGACFAPIENRANYRELWNAPLARETWFDAIVYHEYFGGQGFKLERGAKLPLAALLQPEAMIAAPVDELTALMPGKPVWFTEWNLGKEGIKQWKNTGAELQFLAAIYQEMIRRRGSIEWSCFHQIYEASFGAFYLDKQTGKIQTTASYQLFRLLGAVFEGGGDFRALEIPGEGVAGFATGKEGDMRLFLANRSATERGFTLPAAAGPERKVHLLKTPLEEKLAISADLIRTSAVANGVIPVPAYSVLLVAGTDALAPKGNAAAANLFPPTPHLTLWYEPHAATQPRFNPAGVYAVETKQFQGKHFALITMDLVSLGLSKGGQHTLDLEAASSAGGGLVVKLPDAEQKGNGFTGLASTPKPLRFDFTYDPSVNGGQISFVLTKDVIATGATITLRHFRLSGGAEKQ